MTQTPAQVRYAWFIVFVMILASLIAWVDRQVVAIVVGPMQEDLGIGDTEVGWLYGVFALFYAAAAVPIAVLADRYSRKHLIAIGIFLWSLLTISCGLAKNLAGFSGEDWRRGWRGDAHPRGHINDQRLLPSQRCPTCAQRLPGRTDHWLGLAFIIGGWF